MAPDTREAITSYVTDMLALERHIEKALSGQIKDLDDSPDVVRELKIVHSTCERHIAALEVVAEQRGDTGDGIVGSVKKVASAVLGVGAAAVDFVRSEKLPKDLRDDYTALSLASIGYVMLHTTALCLNDEPVAALAHSHLQAHAKSVMTIHNIIPGAVMSFLREEGHLVQDRMSEIQRNIQGVWQNEPSGAR